MKNTGANKFLGQFFLPILIGSFFGLPSAHAEILGEVDIRLIDANPDAPIKLRHDCLFHDIDGEYVYRWAEGSGLAGQTNCGFKDGEAQLRDARSVWILHSVRAPSRAEPGVDAEYFIFEAKGKRKCMISRQVGDFYQVVLKKFPGGGPVCGTTLNRLARDGNALWNPELGAIRSYATDRCLIFKNEGFDTFPTLFRWSSEPEYAKFCGLPSQRDLAVNQAAFTIDLLR